MLLRHARRSLLVLLAALLALTLPMSQGQAAATGFADTDGTTYEPAVTALSLNDITQGCSDDAYCPSDLLRRDQLATFLVRALELEPSETVTFSDLTENSHASQIETLADAGVVRGCTPTEYCPATAITRGQLASMIDAALDLPATEERFFLDGGTTHGPAIERLAAAGITAGCGTRATHFCTNAPITRGQSAIFLARALGYVPTVTPVTLAEREVQQAEIDRLAEQRRLEEEARRKAEEEAAAKAAAETAAADRLRIWEDLARCESGGNWSINTGNGFYGGLEF
ncbi:MAG: transglycosylase family protein, partial [Nitriliruptor sp.]